MFNHHPSTWQFNYQPMCQYFLDGCERASACNRDVSHLATNTTALFSEDNLCETTFNMQKMYVLRVLKESQTPINVLCILTFICL